MQVTVTFQLPAILAAQLLQNFYTDGEQIIIDRSLRCDTDAKELVLSSFVSLLNDQLIIDKNLSVCLSKGAL